MRKSHFLGALAGGGLSMLIAAAPANAAFIQGSIGFTGAFESVPGPGSTSIVSDLDFFDLDNADNVFNPPATSDFASVTSAQAVDFDINDAIFTIFMATDGTDFTFDVDTVVSIDRTGLVCGADDNCTDTVEVFVSGNVFATDPTLDPTRFTGSFTANGSCIGEDGATVCESDIIANWSATLTANQQPAEVPAPAALLLLGTSLVGLGLLRRAV